MQFGNASSMKHVRLTIRSKMQAKVDAGSDYTTHRILHILK